MKREVSQQCMRLGPVTPLTIDNILELGPVAPLTIDNILDTERPSNYCINIFNIFDVPYRLRPPPQLLPMLPSWPASSWPWPPSLLPLWPHRLRPACGQFS